MAILDTYFPPPESDEQPTQAKPDLSSLLKRVDELSYRAFPSTWSKTEKQLTNELLVKLYAESGKLAGTIDTYFEGDFEVMEGGMGNLLVVLFRLCSVMAIDPTEAVAKHLDTLEKRLERLGK